MSYEELQRENARLRKEAYKKEYEKKKQKGGNELKGDIEVINRHLALDAERKRDSNRCDNRSNNRGMQDKSQNSSKHVGTSQGHSSKGHPNAKKTRDGESGPSHAGTPQHHYSHLQGPQRQFTQGHQGPPYPQSLWHKSPLDCHRVQI